MTGNNTMELMVLSEAGTFQVNRVVQGNPFAAHLHCTRSKP